jgi:hypothetical protein
MTDTTQDDDFYPATAGDDPIWLGGVEYITRKRSDNLVQAAVAAALREAAEQAEEWGAIVDHPNVYMGGPSRNAQRIAKGFAEEILALIPKDAQAALDRVRREAWVEGSDAGWLVGIAAEQERCAQVAENLKVDDPHWQICGDFIVKRQVAAAIRKRED